MGSGREMAREMDVQTGGTGLHAKVLEDMMDQLVIVLMKRLQKNGKVRIPVQEMDDTGQDILSFAVRDGVFHFQLSKKA
jgi:hypothetical protein